MHILLSMGIPYNFYEGDEEEDFLLEYRCSNLVMDMDKQVIFSIERTCHLCKLRVRFQEFYATRIACAATALRHSLLPLVTVQLLADL